MPDLGTLADILARAGDAELAELDQEIALCEKRLRWLRLMRDALASGDREDEDDDYDQPLEAYPGEPRPHSGRRPVGCPTVADRLCASMNGEWMTSQHAARSVEARHGTVRSVLCARKDLFESRRIDPPPPDGSNEPRVEYRRKPKSTGGDEQA